MPELPEVETIRADLEHHVVGRRFTRVDLNWPGCIAFPDAFEFTSALPGRVIERAGRRGKFLVFDLDGDAALTVHLRMTGRLRWREAESARHQHARAVLSLDDGAELHFEDQRKFGRLYLSQDSAELGAVLKRLGPEPLEVAFDRHQLTERLAGRRSQLKPLLLNQEVIAGLGNIYVDEALFRAGLHPLRLAHTLQQKDIERLYDGIVGALRQGIVNRGTTLSDYRDAWGTAGMNKERLLVFRREGQPCTACSATIEKIRVGQRGTHLCPVCQPIAG